VANKQYNPPTVRAVSVHFAPELDWARFNVPPNTL